MLSVSLERSRRGFTLLELVIVIAVAILLAGVGTFSMWRVLESQRLQYVASVFVQNLDEAKESAIAYQQDVNVYIPYGNEDNSMYYYEIIPKDIGTLPVQHYVPGDSPNSYFKVVPMEYKIEVHDIEGSPSSSITINEKKYFVICFRSGAGDTFRGEADVVTDMDGRADKTIQQITTPIAIELQDPKGHPFWIRILVSGKVSAYGSKKPY